MFCISVLLLRKEKQKEREREGEGESTRSQPKEGTNGGRSSRTCKLGKEPKPHSAYATLSCRIHETRACACSCGRRSSSKKMGNASAVLPFVAGKKRGRRGAVLPETQSKDSLSCRLDHHRMALCKSMKYILCIIFMCI